MKLVHLAMLFWREPSFHSRVFLIISWSLLTQAWLVILRMIRAGIFFWQERSSLLQSSLSVLTCVQRPLANNLIELTNCIFINFTSNVHVHNIISFCYRPQPLVVSHIPHLLFLFFFNAGGSKILKGAVSNAVTLWTADVRIKITKIADVRTYVKRQNTAVLWFGVTRFTFVFWELMKWHDQSDLFSLLIQYAVFIILKYVFNKLRTNVSLLGFFIDVHSSTILTRAQFDPNLHLASQY